MLKRNRYLILIGFILALFILELAFHFFSGMLSPYLSNEL